jgi:hypothetical protein
MNYIKTLQQIGDERGERLCQIHERIESMRAHLLSPKFAAVQSDGSRGDWIATADVNRWLQYIEDIAQTSI